MVRVHDQAAESFLQHGDPTHVGVVGGRREILHPMLQDHLRTTVR